MFLKDQVAGVNRSISPQSLMIQGSPKNVHKSKDEARMSSKETRLLKELLQINSDLHFMRKHDNET